MRRTNTRITDVETIEKRFPVIVKEFSIREDSGGKVGHSHRCATSQTGWGGLTLTGRQGRFNGGNGVHREFHFTKDCKTFLIGERRVTQPYGMEGGEPGQSGAHYWMRKNRDGSLRKVNLGPRGTSFGMHTFSGLGVYSSVIVLKLRSTSWRARASSFTHPCVMSLSLCHARWANLPRT